ncbi:family 43 glycosylhydrolase [uncultured Psychrosphaera sp.]|uniref:family 43 glycosylhydrolase n=1 Tax=uncultured Psychrosphaera sp. TaxID=1403522 RepID=UPI0030F6722B
MYSKINKVSLDKFKLIMCISMLISLVLISNTTYAKILDLGPNLRTADPSAHVWKDGKIYLYVSHDLECQQDFHMQDWMVFSSSDLNTWTNHGSVMSLDDLSWADNYAWAPDAIYKNGQYYLVFPAGNGYKDRETPSKSTKWMGLGIGVSKSPTGPFKDAIGKPLWRKPYANDPSIFTDDDGQTYLYFHGKDHDYYVAKMKDDLLSIDGEFIKMDMGGYEPKMEGPWVFKRNDLYYYTMPENNRELAYYTAKSATGPWTYQGVFMEQENNANNHHSIVNFNGQWILFYHRWINAKDSLCGKRQRHSAMENVSFNADGTIQKIQRTD